jgi:hypothetical protein
MCTISSFLPSIKSPILKGQRSKIIKSSKGQIWRKVWDVNQRTALVTLALRRAAPTSEISDCPGSSP